MTTINTIRDVMNTLTSKTEQTSNRIIWVISAIMVIGFALWGVGITIGITTGLGGFTDAPSIIFMLGTGTLITGFIIMAISMILDEIKFQKIMNRRRNR